MTLGERIKKARKYAGLSQPQLAERITGLSQQNLSKMEQGRSNRTGFLVAIARACGVSPNWLESERGPMVTTSVEDDAASYHGGAIRVWENPEDLIDDRYALVPRRRVQLSCGQGVSIEDDPEEPPLAFRTSWLKSKGVRRSDLVVVDAVGDSMEPYISSGDVVLIDTSKRELSDSEIYAIRYGDEVRIKSLSKRYDGGLVMHSLNERYNDESVPPEALQHAHVEIIGLVIWRGGDL